MGARGEITLIDWEHSAVRFSLYDRLVYGLSTRWSRDYLERLQRFAQCRTTDTVLDTLPRQASWRVAVCALFLLEELRWNAEEADSDAYSVVLAGLREHCALIVTLGADLELLRRGPSPV